MLVQELFQRYYSLHLHNSCKRGFRTINSIFRIKSCTRHLLYVNIRAYSVDSSYIIKPNLKMFRFKSREILSSGYNV